MAEPLPEASSADRDPGLGPASPSHVRAGALGYARISFNVAENIVAEHWESYEKGAASADRIPDRGQWRILKDVFVADTDEEARRWSIRSHMARFYNEYQIPVLTKLGYLPILKHDHSVPDSEVDVEYLNETLFITGSPNRRREDHRAVRAARRVWDRTRPQLRLFPGSRSLAPLA